MKTKNIITIINHLANKEEIAKVLDEFNHEPKLCLAGLKYYDTEEDKMGLARKANYDEDVCVSVMKHLTSDIRRLALLQSCNYKKAVCDVAMRSYNFIEKDKSYMTKILKENGYNEIFGESLAEYLENEVS